MPSSSLLPDDPSVLLTTAGMQQFKPYYTGKADPLSSPHHELGGKLLGAKNAVSIQKCFRTSDIDEVGDERHLTFFEMMGNFSFGGYFKEEAIRYAKEFLDSIGVKIDYVTVFEGDSSKGISHDTESERIWNSYGFSREVGNLRLMGRDDNFWGPTGSEGPCGPTTEIYAGGIEIWNIVFNEYYSHKEGTLEKLKTPGVDTGMGLERLAMVSQGKTNIFETDLFSPIFEKLSKKLPERIKRIIADHARAITFLIADGVRPSNKEQGYVLRRLLRRIITYAYQEDIQTPPEKILETVVNACKIIRDYQDLDFAVIKEVYAAEYAKFIKSVGLGLKELIELESVNAQSAFRLYESFGLPYETIKEVGAAKAEGLNREDFDKEFVRHQEISRAGREKKFGGHGLLLDTGELKAANEEELKIVTRLHTATHLTQAALRKVLGDSVHQAGSDITAERMRFDFTFDRKLTPEEIKQIEDWVNMVVQRDVPMGYKELPYEEAIKTGALYFEREKYPPVVKVYSAADPKTGEVFSRELCGGPHVSHTGELTHFKITKEEGVAQGVRRIRAVVDMVNHI